MGQADPWTTMVCVRAQLSLLNIGGGVDVGASTTTATRAATVAGRRRMADVRSLGFSELFVLSKEDLWNALDEFPEARQKMIEVGRERLRQDGLLLEQVPSSLDFKKFISPTQAAKRKHTITKK